MPDLRDNLYLEIEEERHRQEAKWGIQHHGRFEWVTILLEEVGEVAKAANEMDMKGFRKELIECAAVCLAACEDSDTTPEGGHHWDRVKRRWVPYKKLLTEVEINDGLGP